jgi:signal peptide peptidase SppA
MSAPFNYPHIYQKVFNEPWLIEPSAHAAIRHALLNHEKVPFAGPENGDSRKPEEYVDFWSGSLKKINYFHRMGSTARVPISGIIGKHLSNLETMCGGCDLAFFQKGLEQAMADKAIEHIILDINSPGGTVVGVPEFGAMVRRAREVKPVIAYTETLMCSAAMWIGSQAEMIIATPSARVGSIGVYRTWLDDTAANEMDGLKRELFEAGKHKAAGLRPITDEERAIFQSEVDRIHAEFKSEVRRFRPDVPDDAMEGLVYVGEQAQEKHLVDAFVDCFTDLERLLEAS